MYPNSFHNPRALLLLLQRFGQPRGPLHHSYPNHYEMLRGESMRTKFYQDDANLQRYRMLNTIKPGCHGEPQGLSIFDRPDGSVNGNVVGSVEWGMFPDNIFIGCEEKEEEGRSSFPSRWVRILEDGPTIDILRFPPFMPADSFHSNSPLPQLFATLCSP